MISSPTTLSQSPPAHTADAPALTRFEPHVLARGGLKQTMLGRIHSLPAGDLTAVEQPILLDGGPDYTGFAPEHAVRLLGYYTNSQRYREQIAVDACSEVDPARGLILMLHGWQGCSHAKQVLSIVNDLLCAGYDVFRLNLRDHGPGLHADPVALNPGVFVGTLIEEVAAATHQIAQMAGERPFHIVGASLGGSFALRLALIHGQGQADDGFHNLTSVVAVCPVLDPAASTRALDAKPLYRRFYRRLWLASLRRKAAFFPDLYDAKSLAAMPDVWSMTEHLVRETGLFADAQTYFGGYTLHGDAFRDLTVPTRIITSKDDAVVPVADFYEIEPHPLLTLQIHETGGHCGFVDLFPLRQLMSKMILEAL